MRARLLTTATLLSLATACAGVRDAASPPAAPAPDRVGTTSAGAAVTPGAQGLSEAGRAALRGLVQAPQLPELSWADVRGAQDAVRRFYEAGGWELAWTRGALPTPEARALVRALRGAADDGLEPRDYDGPDWEARIDGLETPAPAPEPDRVRFDVLLTVSAVRYLSDLNGARVAPRPSGGGRARGAGAAEGGGFDAAAFLRKRLVEGGEAEAALADAHPPHPAYARILRAFRQYRQLAHASENVPRPRAAPGAAPAGAAAVSLARFLWRLGDVEGDGEPRSGVPAAALTEGIARFQRRHGLEPTGGLDPRTVRALDVPLARRAEQLALALERWRSLPRRPGAPPLVVSLPELRLHATDATPPLSLRMVAGTACARLTPTFASELTRVVLRPASRNAAAQVELVFPNPHAFSLHGSPAEAPAGRAWSDTSRGCLRVERADLLAAWALRGEPLWPTERVQATLAGGERAEVALARPIPVFVVYATAVVGDDGQVRFLEDVSGGDAAFAQTLAREEARRIRGRAP